MRGYAVVALDNAKTGENIGGAMRAVGVYNADLVVLAGERPHRPMGHPCDTIKAWKHVPTLLVNDVFDALPHDCIPIAVDLLDSATPLPNFHHPERAFYIFGAEDATLGRRIIDRCPHKVFVPTRHCMNLAATVNVVLYDRLAKTYSSFAGRGARERTAA